MKNIVCRGRKAEVLNWFDIDMPEGYFNFNDQIGDIMKTIKGKMFIGNDA